MARDGLTPMVLFMDAVACARKLAARNDMDHTAPTLLVTDNHRMRTFLQKGYLPSIRTPPELPVHLDHARHRSLSEHQSTIVDMALLPGASASSSFAPALATMPGSMAAGRVAWHTFLVAFRTQAPLRSLARGDVCRGHNT